MTEFISIKDQLPEKGKDLIVKCTNGETRYVFRCACFNPRCREWRCSITGSGMIISVESWKYE